MFVVHGCSICAASPAKKPVSKRKDFNQNWLTKKVLKRNLFFAPEGAPVFRKPIFFYLYTNHSAMTLSPRERLFSTRWFLDYGMITIGSFIMAVGYVYFITPHKIVPD